MTFETRKAISGVKWSTLNQLLTNGVTVFTSIILMRYLSPSDFGAVGMVTVVTGFLGTLSNTGLGTSLIYKDKLEDIDVSTIYIFQIFIGVFLTILLFILAKPISSFYKNGELISITRILSVVFLINSFGVISGTLLRKELRFKEIFIASFISTLMGSVVALVMALKGFGAYSLVGQYIVAGLVISILYAYFSNYLPPLIFSKTVLQSHFKYSLPLFGNSFFDYWSKNSDNLIIGKFLGAQALGYYSRSYTFMMLPARRLTVALSGVLFPSLVKIKEDHTELIRKFAGISALVALVITPTMALLISIAEPLVNTLMGEEWLEMVIAFQVLCIAGWMQAATMVNSKLFLVLGLTGKLFKVTLYTGVGAVIGFLLGAQFNIEIVAIIYVIISFITAFFSYFIIAKELEVSLWIMSKELVSYFIFFVFLSVLGYLIMGCFSGSILHMFFVSSLILAIYSVILFVFRKNDIVMTKNLINRYVK